MSEAGAIRITLTPSDNFFAQSSPAWRDELADLRTEVHRDLSAVEEKLPPDGSKGDPLTIIALLISTGALTSLINCVKVWIEKHPGRRELDLDYSDGGRPRTLHVTATNIDDGSLKSAIEGAIKRSS